MRVTMTTQVQVRAAFWRAHPQWTQRIVRLPKPATYRKAEQNEYPADVRVAFVDYVDVLCRNGEITEALAQRVTL